MHLFGAWLLDLRLGLRMLLKHPGLAVSGGAGMAVAVAVAVAVAGYGYLLLTSPFRSNIFIQVV